MADPDTIDYVYSPPVVAEAPEFHEDVYPDFAEEPTPNEDLTDQQHSDSASVEPRETSVATSGTATADENASQDTPFMPLFKYSMTKDAIRRRIYRAKQIAKREGKTDAVVIDPALQAIHPDAINPESDSTSIPPGIDPVTGRPWSPGTVPYRRNFQYSTKKDAVRKRRKRVEQIRLCREQGLPIPKAKPKTPARSRASSTDSDIICEGVFPAGTTTPKKKKKKKSGRKPLPPSNIVTEALQIFGPSSVLVVQPAPAEPPRPISPGSMPYRTNFNYSTNKESLKKRRQRLQKMGHKYSEGKLMLSMTKDAIKKRRQRARRLGLYNEDNTIPPTSFISRARPSNLANPLENNTVVPIADIQPPPPPNPAVAEPRVYKLVNYSMKKDAIRKRRQRFAQNGMLLNKELALPTESVVLMPNATPAPPPQPPSSSREASVVFDGADPSSSTDQNQSQPAQPQPIPAGLIPQPPPMIVVPAEGPLNPGQCVYRAVSYSTHKEAVRKRKQRLRKRALKLAQERSDEVETVTIDDDD
uniref:Nuclear transcription factor Y subunit n=1 Tax=Panagrellus redivivus TaxID=6233 RepID=A0A7E4V2S6_PANRE